MVPETFNFLISSFCEQNIIQYFEDKLVIDECSVSIDNLGDNFLKVVFQTNSVLCVNDDPVEKSDDDCVKNSQIQKLRGELHVLLHSAYGIPTPYLRLWKSTGELLSIEEIESALDLKKEVGNVEESGDARYYEFGRLIVESHPYFGSPYCTIHVCLLEDRIMSILQDQKGVAEDMEKIYMLIWFSVVGPYLGFIIRPKSFIEARNKIIK